jgi:hypothetical protein
MGAGGSNVIQVDFIARRRQRDGCVTVPVAPPSPPPALAVPDAQEFLVFWRPPRRRSAAEYLGGRWEWGWVLFVWTRDDLVGESWGVLVDAGEYVPQRLDRESFREFLERSDEVGGLIVNGDIDSEAKVIRAVPDQMLRREDALAMLAE